MKKYIILIIILMSNVYLFSVDIAIDEDSYLSISPDIISHKGQNLQIYDNSIISFLLSTGNFSEYGVTKIIVTRGVEENENSIIKKWEMGVNNQSTSDIPRSPGHAAAFKFTAEFKTEDIIVLRITRSDNDEISITFLKHDKVYNNEISSFINNNIAIYPIPTRENQENENQDLNIEYSESLSLHVLNNKNFGELGITKITIENTTSNTIVKTYEGIYLSKEEIIFSDAFKAYTDIVVNYQVNLFSGSDVVHNEKILDFGTETNVAIIPFKYVPKIYGEPIIASIGAAMIYPLFNDSISENYYFSPTVKFGYELHLFLEGFNYKSIDLSASLCAGIVPLKYIIAEEENDTFIFFGGIDLSIDIFEVFWFWGQDFKSLGFVQGLGIGTDLANVLELISE